MISTTSNRFATEAETQLTFEASTVTGSRRVPVEVLGSLSAETVATSVAHLMSLPSNVPWALRDDDSSVYLDPGRPIRDQIQPGARLTVTPRTHLG